MQGSFMVKTIQQTVRFNGDITSNHKKEDNVFIL